MVDPVFAETSKKCRWILPDDLSLADRMLFGAPTKSVWFPTISANSGWVVYLDPLPFADLGAIPSFPFQKTLEFAAGSIGLVHAYPPDVLSSGCQFDGSGSQ
jgi:hypothetical protein